MHPKNPKENSLNCLQNVFLLVYQLSLMCKLTTFLNRLAHARQLRFNQYYLGGCVVERVEAVGAVAHTISPGTWSGGRGRWIAGEVWALSLTLCLLVTRDLEKVI